MIWFVIPALKTRTADYANHTISLIVFIQYVPRFFVIFPLHRRIIKNSGAIAKTAWAGAAYNLALYILASHVSTKLHFLIFASLLYENAEVTTVFFITKSLQIDVIMNVTSAKSTIIVHKVRNYYFVVKFIIALGSLDLCIYVA